MKLKLHFVPPIFMLVLMVLFSAATSVYTAQADCPEAPAPRLVVGEFGRVLPGDANNVRDIPSRDGVLVGQIPGDAQFLVLDGPTCANGFYWWQVDYLGMIGWTVEGAGGEYFVEPLAPEQVIPTTAPTPIPAAPVSPFQYSTYNIVNTVQVGIQARVNMPGSGNDALIIRVEARRSASEVTRLDEGTLITITDGPVEQDSLIWWQIETQDGGVQGWAVEGLAGAVEGSNSFYPTLVPLCPYTENRIAFVAIDNYQPPGVTDIYSGSSNLYTMGLNGEDVCNLTYFTYEDEVYIVDTPLWSPDGIMIAFVAGELSLINADGTGLIRISQGSDRFGRITWSPDGTEIAFARTLIDQLYPQLWVTNLEGDRLRALTSEDGYHSLLGWVPGTEQVVFTVDPEGDVPPSFRAINADLSAPRTIAEGGGFNVFGSISPDGTQLAFPLPEFGDAVTAISLIDLTTGETAFVTDLHNNEFPVWSPDGSMIAYWRDEFTSNGLNLLYDLMVVDPQTQEARELVSDAIDFFINPPVWSKDGSTLYYLVEREGIYRVDVEGGTPVLILKGDVMSSSGGWKEAFSIN
jgi:Tol biopolymer transport system component